MSKYEGSTETSHEEIRARGNRLEEEEGGFLSKMGKRGQKLAAALLCATSFAVATEVGTYAYAEQPDPVKIETQQIKDRKEVGIDQIINRGRTQEEGVRYCLGGDDMAILNKNNVKIEGNCVDFPNVPNKSADVCFAEVNGVTTESVDIDARELGTHFAISITTHNSDGSIEIINIDDGDVAHAKVIVLPPVHQK